MHFLDTLYVSHEKLFCIKILYKKTPASNETDENLLYHSILYGALQYGFNKTDIHPL